MLEDQTGWQLTYDAPAPPPLAAHDTDGRVILMESISKSIFPALRIGYLYAKGGIAEALEAAKVRADVFTSTLTQRALWRFMDSPAYQRHLRATRALYRNRRDAFVEALSRVAIWTEAHSPGAGVNVWLPLPPRISTQAAFDACAREGVLVMPSEPFYPTRSGPPALRLSFGDLASKRRTKVSRAWDARLQNSVSQCILLSPRLGRYELLRVVSVRSSTRMRHESSDALRIEKTIAISTAPNASGRRAISAQTIDVVRMAHETVRAAADERRARHADDARRPVSVRGSLSSTARSGCSAA